MKKRTESVRKSLSRAEDLTAARFEALIENEPSDLKRNFDRISLVELKKVKKFFPSKKCLMLPALHQGSVLSYFALENIRLELQIYLCRIGKRRAAPLSKALEDIDDHLPLDPTFIDLLWGYTSFVGSKARVLERNVRKQLILNLSGTLASIEEKLEKMRKRHKDRLCQLLDLPKIDQDIFARAVQIQGYLDLTPQREIDEEIKDIVDSLTPLHKKMKVYERLRPTSDLFCRGFLDIDFRKIAGWSWNRNEVMIPPRVEKSLFGITAESRKDLLPAYEISSPSATMNDVILPQETKKRINDLCRQYRHDIEQGKDARLIFLFAGPPGTGKTLTANAIAREIGQSLLTVHAADISSETPMLISFFNERALAGNHTLLFDECEDMLGSNPFKGITDGWAKIAFEKFKGVAIFATNYDVPYGFHRRVTCIVKFKRPGAEVRKTILHQEITRFGENHRLREMPDGEEINEMAKQHSIAGGYYPQILQMAAAQSKSGTLEAEALRESFSYFENVMDATNNDEAREARIELRQIHLDSAAQNSVESFVRFVRDRHFRNSPLLPRGATALFSGPSGTGKTITAEAIANELGMPFRRVSPSTFLSMYVGETERKIREVFREAMREKYLLFIDEAEGLFLDREGAVRSWEKTQADELLQQVEAFSGVLIIATNHAEMMDSAFARRFLFHVPFQMPNVSTRIHLWSEWFETLGLDADAVKVLSEQFELTGGEIRNVAVRAHAMGKTSLPELISICDETQRNKTGQVKRRIGL